MTPSPAEARGTLASYPTNCNSYQNEVGPRNFQGMKSVKESADRKATSVCAHLGRSQDTCATVSGRSTWNAGHMVCIGFLVINGGSKCRLHFTL